MTVKWCMVPEISSTEDRIFCHFGPFLPFYTPNNPKNRNFEKMKKAPGDIIILHMCIINDNHMMYDSWDMKCDRQHFLSFWTVFGSFNPLNNLTNQNFEKLKKSSWWYYHFTQVYWKSWSYAILFLRYGAWQMSLFFILGPFLPF